jgi:hypothetical protein
MKHSTFERTATKEGINGSSWKKSGISEFEPIFSAGGYLLNAPCDFSIAHAIGLTIKGFRVEYQHNMHYFYKI